MAFWEAARLSTLTVGSARPGTVSDAITIGGSASPCSKLGGKLAGHQDQAVGMFLAHHVDMGRYAVLVVAGIAHQHLEARFARRFFHALVDLEIKRVADIPNEKDDGVVGLAAEACRLRIGDEVRLPDGVENLLAGFRANLVGLLQRPRYGRDGNARELPLP